VLEQAPARTCGPVEREKPMLKQICWQNLRPHGGPTMEQPAAEGLHPIEGTHTGVVCEKFVENSLP